MNKDIVFVDQVVKIRWYGKAIKHYRALGYTFTGKGSELIVSVEHLSLGSHEKVRVKCLKCCDVRFAVFKDIVASGNSFCKRCTDLEFYPGQKFGKLTIVSPTTKRSGKCMVWLCQCECGRTVYASSSRLSRDVVQSCQMGKCNIRWNSGISREERFYHRGRKRYTQWREMVFRKDSFSCCACHDKTGGNLIAHHLDGWDKFKMKRFDVGNGVTLCKTCHKKFHERYGYGGNTKRQYEEWLMTKELSDSARYATLRQDN